MFGRIFIFPGRPPSLSFQIWFAIWTSARRRPRNAAALEPRDTRRKSSRWCHVGII